MVVKNRYVLNENGWDVDLGLYQNRCNPWLTIVKDFDSFFSNLRYMVGDGSKVCFLENPWMEDDYFSVRFSRLYSLYSEKNSLINRPH